MSKLIFTKYIFLPIILLVFTLNSCDTKTDKVSILKNKQGMKLVVNGEDFIINGMNWDYFPIGTNFSYSLWKQSDAFIKTALDAEMNLLKEMGVNTIRVYEGIQPQWITYIYKEYGIYTMLNHSFGRYGVAINGNWDPETDYSNANAQQGLLTEVSEMAEAYKNTPGLLLFLLGNENNYGLFWAGSETEDFPEGETEKNEIGELRGRAMYKLMNEAAIKMKEIDKNHPVAICNGDDLYIDIIAEECKDVDIYGTNMYRGKSFGDAFERVKKTLNMPILFTEFGADAFNSLTQKEDQKMQAYYMLENWKEIYENVSGLEKAGNAIGGFTFQFSDGWWKLGQTTSLDIHDNHASWANGGYALDYVKGANNMSEEWFGICAKGPTDTKGFYTLTPRAAYFALQKAHQLNPYAKGITTDLISKHFREIKI
ncbi:glycoside hydrolase family 2 TIM barrel-domain containing protein [Polaribacter atrinae]|uniref:glycoside hydrolase family 2 TIM barrel-domain containing protein n=1 Tax=Polaribacter atrinae TaxID=1333662 RepID=UPI00248FEAB9|nr:glycoside hydrolase family 2 TIM barrel-domain containing protein [Polaribacter atrinae]